MSRAPSLLRESPPWRNAATKQLQFSESHPVSDAVALTSADAVDLTDA